MRNTQAISLAILLITGMLAGCGATSAPVPADQTEPPEQAATSDAPAAAEQAAASDAPAAAEQAAASDAPAAAERSDTMKNEESIGAVTAEIPALPLKELFADDFRMGVAVQAIDHWNDPTAEIGNPDKEALIRREFNSITFGNEWKPAYNFDPSSPTLYKTDPAAEELLIWAKENGIPVRGHTLVWHSQCNPAIFAKDFQATANGKATADWNAALDEACLVDRETLLARLRTYIRGVMEYTYANGFADTVYAFDVLNEATEEKNPDGLRQSYYYKIIGPEFIYCCFLFAREAEHDFAAQYASLYGLDAASDDLSPILPKLFYNDYNEWFPARTEIITRFLTKDRFNEGQSLIASDIIPADGDGTIAGDGLIDGIGMQGHLDDTQNIEQYIKALRAYAAIVDEVHITELDVGETASGAQAHLRQAQFYHDFFAALLSERQSGIHLTSVTFWGLTDDASWRHGANPLLFAGDLSPKPAYAAIGAAARGEDYDAETGAILRDASALAIDFEPRMDDGALVLDTPELLGFRSRGSGHQASLKIVNEENHTADAAVGRSLRVRREERDATLQLDISRFIGGTVRVSVWTKTADGEITLGLAAGEDRPLTKASAGENDWIHLTSEIALDETLKSANLYIETNGSGDFYIDDVRVDSVS